ncbi:hypothetical protein J2O08_16775 [Elizabethkingia anophelis]|uniref:hypothetical protein n=1 Tax=Elizabethkingia anophelis TaxID=1117645 RepID=UPI0020B2876B|nr:hypothetical protein [Elizabethkingia anophelis]MDV3956639.1 hypothetical protein [Elizabethkingia anophelis]UTF92831.1 hypothetical protein J2O08_16775 [Elizabethkingia anophelis]
MHIESRNYEIILACKDYLPLHHCNINILAIVHLDAVSPARENREYLKKFLSLYEVTQNIIVLDDGAIIFD